MITEDKVIEIYCFVDDFCKVFSAQVKKHQVVFLSLCEFLR